MRYQPYRPKFHSSRLRFIFLGFLLVILLGGCGFFAEGPVKTWQYANVGLYCGNISSDGNHAVIGSIYNGGSYWNISGFKRMYSWNHKAKSFTSILVCDISGDGKRALTASENTLVEWNTETGKSINYLQTPSNILAAKLSQDGSFALVGMQNNKAIYFNLKTGVKRFTFEHTAPVRSVDLTADGKFAITAGDDMKAKIWELDNGKNIKTFTLRNQIRSAAISPKGTYAFASSQREASIIWDLKTGKPKYKLPTRYTNFTVATFSTDERFLFLGTFMGRVEQLDVATGKIVKQWQAKQRKIYGGASSRAIVSVGFSSNHQDVLALTSDGMLEKFSP